MPVYSFAPGKPTSPFFITFSDQVSALQSLVDSFEAQLEEQEAEATRVIQVWEEQVNEAEEDNRLLSIELEKAKSSTEVNELRDSLARGEERFSQVKGTHAIS